MTVDIDLDIDIDLDANDVKKGKEPVIWNSIKMTRDCACVHLCHAQPEN